MKLDLSSSFPGGNVEVLSVQGDKAFLKPDMRDTSGDWFYWHFQADFDEIGYYEFIFDNVPAIGPRGPAASFDGGLNWQWLGAESVFVRDGNEGFRFRVAKTPLSVRFAMSIPYLKSDLDRFLGGVDADLFRKSTLCVSRKNRPVELLRIGSGPRKVLLTCRHHCCESMASFVLEGIMRHATSDSEQGADFRNRVELTIVPFVDKDGVEDGDQGKNRRPHDHNRDYNEKPLYPEVASLMTLIMSERPSAILDLHCPWLRGDCNESIYLVGVQDAARQANIDAFSMILEMNASSTIPYRQADNIPYGEKWNTASSFSAGLSLCHWAEGILPSQALISSVEIPYATASGATVDVASARHFGEAIAVSISEFLQRR